MVPPQEDTMGTIVNPRRAPSCHAGKAVAGGGALRVSSER